MKKLLFILLIFIVLNSTSTTFAAGWKQQWFFLMSGASGSASTDVYVVVGPFKNLLDCDKINTWAKQQHNGNRVSICWSDL